MNRLIITMLLLPFAASAQTPFEMMEVFGKNFVVSKDGTGIIKNISCPVCKKNTLNITAQTQFFVSGEPVSAVSVKDQLRTRVVSIRFDIESSQVQTVRW